MLDSSTLIIQYSFCVTEIGHTVFKICLFLVSLYYIVFANILMKLMRKIGEICSLILVFANILPIFHEKTFILLLSYRVLV